MLGFYLVAIILKVTPQSREQKKVFSNGSFKKKLMIPGLGS